jgi:hypothetical protein
MPAHVARGNARRGRIRARVEHVFAQQKRRLGLVIRTVGLDRATTKITLANLACNIRRLTWPDGRGAPAWRPRTAENAAANASIQKYTDHNVEGLGSVDIHFSARIEATRRMAARKLVSVLS